MKKALVLLSLLLSFSLAEANPLFFPQSKTLVIQGQYEYFYDDYGNLLGCEDVGSSGMVYFYNGEGWEEEGYFVEENGWCLYYCTWRDNAYVGKVKTTTEYFRDGLYDKVYSKSSRFYVDERNRPVATYNETLSGATGDDFKTLFGAIETAVNPLRALLNGGKPVERTIFVLKGKVRLYSN